MIKHHQAVIKADVAIGQFEVIDGAAREFRLGEIFQIVTPVTETAAERKRQVNLIQQLKLRHERIQKPAMDCRIGSGAWRPAVRDPAISQREPKERKVRNGFATTNE